MTNIDPMDFRRVLGAFPTGVVIITAMDQKTDTPLAMVVGSFVSVSLDPPLVGFLPTKTSSSWAALQSSGTTRFGVNVLSSEQEDVCRAVARRKTEKLDGFSWKESTHGNPVIDGSVAFIDCEVDSVSDAGDHDWVMGKVLDLYTLDETLPLLFFRGGYGSFDPGAMVINTDVSVNVLRQLDRVRPGMESLADRLASEVTVMSLLDGELITVAAAGQAADGQGHARVGLHVPFMPPIGGVFAAFGGDDVEARWFAQAHQEAEENTRKKFEDGLANVRERGFAYGIGHQAGAAITDEAREAFGSADPASRKSLGDAVNNAAETFNIIDIDDDLEYEFHSATAPIFGPDGRCLFSLTVWGPSSTTKGSDIKNVFAELNKTASEVSAILGRDDA